MQNLAILCQFRSIIISKKNSQYMFNNSTSRIVRNQLLTDQQTDYVRSNKIKSRLREKQKQVERTPFEDRTNKLQSLQNAVKPQNLQLIGYQSGEEDEQDDLKNQRISNGQNISIKLDNCKISETQKQNIPKNNIKQVQKQVQKVEQKEIQFGQQNRSKKPIEQNSEKVGQKVEVQHKCSKLGRDRRKIFNLDFQDSSSEQDQTQCKRQYKQIEKQKIQCNPTSENNQIKNQTQNKQNSFLLFNQLKQKQLDHNTDHNKKQKTEGDKVIFQDNQENQPKKPFMRFDVQISDDNQEEPQSFVQQDIKRQQIGQVQQNREIKEKQGVELPSKSNRKRFILNQFNSSQSQQQQKSNGSQNAKLNNTQQQEYQEIIRNMNVRKLQSHFQYTQADQNFISFCSIPQQTKICLIVKRNLQNSQYTIYDSQLVCLVLRIQKQIGGTYKVLIPLKQKKGQHKQIAKIKSNFLGTQFHCYASKQSKNKQKYQCASIVYEMNILGLNGPRKIKMYASQNPIPNQTNLLQLHQKNLLKGQQGIKVLQSKTPKWMPQLNAYVLNLRGTASHSSIKNCIIVDSNNQNKQYIIFGKKAKDIFNLQIKHPMTILQGVAFAISSFQRKLACQ